ncbi:MAG: iron ABC transporter permease [Chloroflexi bacterium]|nr:iron ABC transporter permease [Chloroflexota bacterium]
MAVVEARAGGRPRATSIASLLRPETPLFAIALLAALFIVGLVVVVLYATVIDGLPGVEGKLSLVNYSDVMFSSVTYRALTNTIWLGLGTVAINFFFAVPIAWLIHRTSMPFKTVFLTLMYLGITIPGFLRAIAWILLLSPKIGLVNQFLRIFLPTDEGPLSIYNLPGIAFVQGLGLTAVMFFMISAAFLAVDPALEESAEVSGARKLSVMRRISLPLIAPALAAAGIYNFMTAVSMFDTPALLGAPSRIHVLSTLMFYTVHTDIGLPRYGVAGVYGVVLLVPTLIALYYYQKMLRRSYRYAVVTGKGYKPKLVELGPWKWAGVGFVSIFFFLELFLPLLVLIWTSLVPYIRLPSSEAFASINAEGYRYAIDALLGRPLTNTLIMVLAVMFGVLFVSTIISWVVLRTRMPGRYTLDSVAMLPHAVPSIAFAFAIAFIALSLGKVLPLYGSLVVIILAHVVAYVSFGTRTINGALIQIHRDLEEAVSTSGGSRITAIRKVILPLLAPALFYSGLWVGLLSYREVTMALFLQTPQNKVFSTVIWTLWGANKPSQAAALGVIMFVGTMIIVVILLRTASQYVYGLRRR